MSTIPSRLARSARMSVGSSEARHRVLELYRDWYRAAPEICSLYALNASPAYIRHAVRQKFEKNRYVTDPRAIDVLIHKSRQDYQETMNLWKQNDHVLGLLLVDEGPKAPKSFLQKFYEGEILQLLPSFEFTSRIGRDEEAVIPAASGVH